MHAPATVREVVEAGRAPLRPVGRLRREDHDAVDEALERVGMTHLSKRPLTRLSGGQQQRAFIAKALAARPSLLVLDEPTTGVDVEAQEALGALLDRLHSELGVTCSTSRTSSALSSISSTASSSCASASSSTAPRRTCRACGTTRRTHMLDLEFMRLAFAAGAIVGVLAPTVGFFLVQREMSLIGDGIGHVAFAGVAAGYLLGVSPVWTALVAALIGAAGIEWLRARRRAAGDQALAIVFYTGIAGGVVLISAAGALNANLFAYLFGSILTVTRTDLAVIAGLGIGALVVVAVLLRALVAVSLDEEAARVAGLPVPWLNALVSMLAALTIGVSMRIVGILLIAALMVLPVVAAQRVAWSLRSTIALSIVLRARVGARRPDDLVLRQPAAGRDDRAHGDRALPRRLAGGDGQPPLDGRARFRHWCSTLFFEADFGVLNGGGGVVLCEPLGGLVVGLEPGECLSLTHSLDAAPTRGRLLAIDERVGARQDQRGRPRISAGGTTVVSVAGRRPEEQQGFQVESAGRRHIDG